MTTTLSPALTMSTELACGGMAGAGRGGCGCGRGPASRGGRAWGQGDSNYQ
jgi:hypothetical protein